MKQRKLDLTCSATASINRVDQQLEMPIVCMIQV